MFENKNFNKDNKNDYNLKEDLYKKILYLIEKNHDKSLVNKELAPNDNIIYHIYNDGEITEQKGSWAYLARTERTLENGISNNFNSNIFPIKSIYDDKNMYGYAIMSKNNCYELRKLMQEYE
jgi:hypothetical protein